MKYDVIRLDQFLSEMSPCNDWKHPNLPFDERAVWVFIMALRHASMDKFPDTYRKPLRFRTI